MLMAIRSWTKGIAAWVIVAFITVPFALWGISSYLEGRYQNALWVNGEDVSQAQYRNAFENIRRGYVSQSEQRPDSRFFSSPIFQQEVIGQIAEDLVMRQYLEQTGFVTSDFDLRRYIREAPIFQQDGNFDAQLYERILAQNRLTPQGFESEQRIALRSQQFSLMMNRLVHVEKAEIDDLIALAQQVRKTDYVMLSADRFLEEVELDEEQIAGYFEQNQQRYRTPAKARLDYVEMSPSHMEQGIEISDQALQQAYQARRSSYGTAERRFISHILKEVNDDESASQDQARKAIEALYQQLNQGADFAQLAREHSDDIGSAEQGGDLGQVYEGQYEPVVQAAIHILAKGEVSQPIRSTFGYHLIKLDDLIEASYTPLDEVKEELRTELVQEQALKEYQESFESFLDLAYQGGDDLEKLADDFGLSVVENYEIEADKADSVFQNAEVKQTLLNDAGIEEGRYETSYNVGLNREVVVVIRQRTASVIPALDEVRVRVERDWRNEQAEQRLEQQLKQWTEALNAGTLSWAELMEREQLSEAVEQLDARRNPRGMDGVQAELSLEVFEQPQRTSLPYYGWYQNGHASDYTLYAFNAIEQAEQDSENQPLRDSIENLVHQRFGGLFVSLLQKQLLSQASVERNEQILSQIEQLSGDR